MVLIRSVLNFIPIYQMSVNVLSKGIKMKIHGMFSRFLWGGLVDKKRIHLVKWESITMPVYQGGLGIFNLRDMGKALAAKWIYNFANNKEALWRKVVCAKSKSDQNSLLPDLGNKRSHSVLLGFVNPALGSSEWVTEVIMHGFRILIGDG